MTRWAAIVLACALCCIVTACSDDDDNEASDIAITGRVLDAQGQPVAGAGILIDYTVVSEVLSVAIPYPIAIDPVPEVSPAAVGDSTCVDVYDWCGESVARFTCEGDQVCTWNGHDADGLSVPPGLYHLNPYDCESYEPLTESLVFVAPDDVESMLNSGTRPLAVTDADGRFSIARCLIPLGDKFNCTLGEPGGQCEIAADVTLYAWQGSDWGNVGATVSKTGTVSATIQFEE